MDRNWQRWAPLKQIQTRQKKGWDFDSLFPIRQKLYLKIYHFVWSTRRTWSSFLGIPLRKSSTNHEEGQHLGRLRFFRVLEIVLFYSSMKLWKKLPKFVSFQELYTMCSYELGKIGRTRKWYRISKIGGYSFRKWFVHRIRLENDYNGFISI